MAEQSLFGRYASNLNRVEDELETGSRNPAEAVLGTAYYGFGQPVEQALEAVLPDLGIGEFIGDQLSRTGLPQYIRENTSDRFRRNVSEGLGVAGAIPVVSPVARGLSTLFTDTALNPAMRGSFVTGGDVFKRGHYNPTQVEVGQYRYDSNIDGQDRTQPRSMSDSLGMLSRISRPVEQFALDVLNPTEQVLNKYKTAKGHAKFFLSGAGGVTQMLFSPRARALYADYGISRSMDRAYARYQNAVESGNATEARQALIEAHQQAQQTGIIRQQVGAEAKEKDFTESFLEAASDPNSPAPPVFKPSNYGDNWYEELASPAATFSNFPSSKANFIQDHIESVWGGLRGYDRSRTNATIKTPRSDITGNHFTDVLAENPSVRTAIGNVFLDKSGDAPALRQFGSVDELRDALEPLTRDHKYTRGERAGQVKKDSLGKNELPSIQIKGVDEDGVWVTIPGLVGKSGKVEGGINALVHVNTRGELIGVMSDMHNFLEEIPVPGTGKRVRNRPMESVMKEDYLNVTPPMQTNVVSISPVGKFGDAAEELREAAGETMPVPARAQSNKNNPAAQQRLEETMSQEVSPASYAREAYNAFATPVAITGMALGSDEEDPLAPTIE